MLFTIWGDQSLGYFSCKTRHYPSRHLNNGDESSEEEGMEVSLGEESLGHRYLDTSHSSSINCGGRESREHGYQETRHSTSINHGGFGRR